MATFDDGWICKACWCANRDFESRCYRCHTDRPDYGEAPSAKTTVAASPAIAAPAIASPVPATAAPAAATSEPTLFSGALMSRSAPRPRPATTDAETLAERPHFCTACGQGLLEGARFCTKCGEPAEPGIERPQPIPTAIRPASAPPMAAAVAVAEPAPAHRMTVTLPKLPSMPRLPSFPTFASFRGRFAWHPMQALRSRLSPIADRIQRIRRLANERGVVLLAASWFAVLVICVLALYVAVLPGTQGRVAVNIVALLGIGLFSAMTAAITSTVLATRRGSRSGQTDQLRALDTLRDAGIVSPDEYAFRRAEVLRRIPGEAARTAS